MTTFGNKTAMRRWVLCVLRSDRKDLTDGEWQTIADLLPTHPNYEEHWTLCRHKHWDGEYYTLCVFGDGQHWPTSYAKLGMPKDVGARQQLMDAYRRAVMESTAPVRRPDEQVDHINPGGFAAIVCEYEELNGVMKIFPIIGGHVFSDEDALRFRAFHDQRAELESVSSSDHRRRTSARGRKLR